MSLGIGPHRSLSVDLNLVAYRNISDFKRYRIFHAVYATKKLIYSLDMIFLTEEDIIITAEKL
jgi:hypothetical protein